MDVLELLYDYFEDRARATALIRRHRPFVLGLLGALAGGSSLFFAEALSGKLTLLSFSWPSFLLALMWQLTMLFFTTALLHLILDLTGARGGASALFVHLGLSELAWLAAVPAVLIAQILAPRSPWPVRLTFLGIGLWSWALKARAMRDEYAVGEARAWVTLGLPYLALAALAAVTTTLALAALLVRAYSS